MSKKAILPTVMKGPTVLTPGLSVSDPSTDVPEGYSAIGMRYPILTRELAPGETTMAEPGSMLLRGDDVKMSAGLMGRGLMGALKAGLGGELIKVTYENKGSSPDSVSLAGNAPFGSLVVIDLNANGGKFLAKPGSYFASDPNVKVTAQLLQASSVAACCCGGMPPIVQAIQGSGHAFILGSGSVAAKELAAGEKILVSTEAILGFSDSVSFDVKQVGSCLTCCCGGEGCYNTALEGPGTVYMQSFGPEKLAALMPPKNNGGGGGDGGGGGGGGGGPDSSTMDR